MNFSEMVQLDTLGSRPLPWVSMKSGQLKKSGRGGVLYEIMRRTNNKVKLILSGLGWICRV